MSIFSRHIPSYPFYPKVESYTLKVTESRGSCSIESLDTTTWELMGGMNIFECERGNDSPNEDQECLAMEGSLPKTTWLYVPHMTRHYSKFGIDRNSQVLNAHILLRIFLAPDSLTVAIMPIFSFAACYSWNHGTARFDSVHFGDQALFRVLLS